MVGMFKLECKHGSPAFFLIIHVLITS